MLNSVLDPEQQDVLNAIKAKPGCSSDYIYSTVSLERIDIAKIIHRLTQLSLIFKQDNAFFTVGVSDKDVKEFEEKKRKEQEDKLLAITQAKAAKKVAELKLAKELEDSKPKVEVVTVVTPTQAKEETKKYITDTPTKFVDKHNGNLNKGSASGAVAYFFYANRNSGIAYSTNNIAKELGKFTGLGDKVKPLVYILATAGFIKPIDPKDFRKFYVWSGKFAYPFTKQKPEDVALIPGNEIETEPEEEQNVVTEGNKECYDAIVNSTNLVNQSSGITITDSSITSQTTISELGKELVGKNNSVNQLIGLSNDTSKATAIEVINIRMIALNNELSNLSLLKDLLSK